MTFGGHNSLFEARQASFAPERLIIIIINTTRNKISNSTELQTEQVRIRASFGIENGILRDPQVLIGLAKLFDISAANQNQGGKFISSPRITRLARKKVRFTVCHLAARIDKNCKYW